MDTLSGGGEISQTLGSAADALGSGLWRAGFGGGLLICFVWVVCRAFPRLPANVRFGLWWLACAKLVVGLLLAAATIPLPVLPARRDVPGLPAIMARLAPPTPFVVPQHSGAVPAPASGHENTEVTPAETRPPATANPLAHPASALEKVSPTDRFDAAPPPVPFSVWAITLYVAGVGAYALMTGRAAGRLKSLLRRTARPATKDSDAALLDHVENAAQAVRLTSLPRVWVSPAVASPLVVGLLRPVVVVPEGFANAVSPHEAQMALAHEMAHLKRFDLLLGVVPALARALFFFFPLAHVAFRECEACREEACDVLALQATHAAPSGYGALLLKMVSRQAALAGRSHSGGATAVGMASPGYSALRRRLLVIGDAGQRTPAPAPLRRALCLLLAVCGVAVAPWRLTGWASARTTAAGGDANRALTPVYEVPHYVLTDLGTLGGEYSHAFGISDTGIAVGAASVPGWRGRGHAVLFEPRTGKLTDLSRVSKYRRSLAYAVNDRGEAAASAYNRPGRHYAFVWTGGQRRYIGSLPGYRYSKAVGINDRGQAVGVALSGRTDDAGREQARAFLWDRGHVQDLGTLGGPNSHAYAVNESGQAVGKADLPAPSPWEIAAGFVSPRALSGATHAFLWQSGAMRDLGALPGGANSLAYAVNNKGRTVGYSETADGLVHAFAADVPVGAESNAAPPVLHDLGALPDYKESVAYGVSNAGFVVGAARQTSDQSQAKQRAVLWVAPQNNAPSAPLRIVDLNERVASGSGWTLETARAINSEGQIVGQGVLHGKRRAFLLTPVAP